MAAATGKWPTSGTVVPAPPERIIALEGEPDLAANISARKCNSMKHPHQRKPVFHHQLVPRFFRPPFRRHRFDQAAQLSQSDKNLLL